MSEPYLSGPDLRAMMKAHKLKGAAIARILDVHPNTITAWKRGGAPKMAAMAMMCHLAGLTPKSSAEMAALKRKTGAARGI